MRGSVPFPIGKSCPCDSGRAYGGCCSLRAIEYRIDRKGRVLKVDTIGDDENGRELLSSLNEADNKFQKIFGRKPAGNDPLIIETYLYSEEDFKRQMDDLLDSMEGIRPEVIYATKKTGLFVTESNMHKLSKKDLDEWNAATSEYLGGKAENVNLPENYYGKTLEYIFSAICHLGSALKKFPKNSAINGNVFMQYYIVSRSLDLLRFEHEIFKNAYNELIYANLRTVYENYLRLIFLRKCPDFYISLMSQIGVNSYPYVSGHIPF